MTVHNFSQNNYFLTNTELFLEVEGKFLLETYSCECWYNLSTREADSSV